MGRAGALGAVLGLSLVAVFVVGARVAHHSGGSAKESGAPERTASPRSQPTSQLTSQLASARHLAPDHAPVATLTSTIAPTPGPAGQAPAWLRPQVRAGTAADAPRVPTVAPAAPTTTGGTHASSPKPAVAAFAVGANIAHGPVTTGDPAEADSAATMIPVIPPSPPTEVDPLVQAVQQDIEEDRSHAK